MDLIILANGPGELTTWVYPVLERLHQRYGCYDERWRSPQTNFQSSSAQSAAAEIDKPPLRISIVLSPCSHASGQEAAIAMTYPGVDRVLPAENFMAFLLTGKTPANDASNSGEPNDLSDRGDRRDHNDLSERSDRDVQSNHSNHADHNNWHWHKRGLVLFLGGDQLFPVIIAKRLGYASIIYAEWEARWLNWVDHFAVRNQQVAAAIPAKFAHKVTIVGDLMVDRQLVQSPQTITESNRAANIEQDSDRANKIIAIEQKTKTSDANNTNDPTAAKLIVFMPGSKSMKLQQGVPLCLGIADRLKQHDQAIKFAIALAPTLTPQKLSEYAKPSKIVDLVSGSTAQLVTRLIQEQVINQQPVQQSLSSPLLSDQTNTQAKEQHSLITPAGTEVEIYTKFPAHDLLSRSTLCVTTIGANTAQLAALAVPMIVLLPTNQLDAMRAWDGLWGLLASLPLIGGSVAKLINRIVLFGLRNKRLAWPNIWANTEVVPERIGYLTPTLVVDEMILPLLENPARLAEMSAKLRSLCGRPGAADRIVDLIGKYLDLEI
jgi:lipid A disaccharide synthetase